MATWITLTDEPDLVSGVVRVTPYEGWELHVLCISGKLDAFWSTPEMNMFEVTIGQA